MQKYKRLFFLLIMLFPVLSCTGTTYLTTKYQYQFVYSTGVKSVKILNKRYLLIGGDCTFNTINTCAISEMKEGHFLDAINLLDELVLLYPNSAMAYNNLAVAHEKCGDYDIAFNYFVKACLLCDDEIYRYNLQNMQTIPVR